MKKYTAFIVCSLVMFFLAAAVFAQPGFPDQPRLHEQERAVEPLRLQGQEMLAGQSRLPRQERAADQQRVPRQERSVVSQKLHGQQKSAVPPRAQNQQRPAVPQRVPGQQRLTEEQRLQWQERFAERLSLHGQQRLTDEQRLQWQQRFTEWQRFLEQQRAAGQQRLPGQQSPTGFTGPSQAVNVADARSFAHRTPLIVRGTIVHSTGPDRYLFRDSSGDITVRIGANEWRRLGSTVSPSDTVEISGELHTDQNDTGRAPEIRARTIRKID